MAPLILGSVAAGLGTTVLGGIMGAKEAERQKAEQARREKYNQMMSALDTKYAAFGQAANSPRLAESPVTTSADAAWGNAAIGGLQQGMNVYGGLSAMNNNAQIADALKNKYAAAPAASPSYGSGFDPHANYYSSLRT